MSGSSRGDAPVPLPPGYLEQAGRPEAEATVRARLGAKLRGVAGDNRLVAAAREVYGYLTDPRVPQRYRVMAVAALLYFINPFDVIPDWLPGVGYLDDAAALAALVAAVREIIAAARDATTEVISTAVVEAQEAFARRGMTQVCLALWASTLAACVGLVYTGVRLALIERNAARPLLDPFFLACMVVAAFGFAQSLHFARRVWVRYRTAPPAVREPLAYAILSLTDWRLIAAMALPVVALLVILGVRLGLMLAG